MQISDGEFEGMASGQNAVDHLTELSISRMKEQEKTKRVLIISEVILVMFSIVIMLYGPEGKENISYIFGAILLVLALGAIGAQRFVFKIFGISVDTR